MIAAMAGFAVEDMFLKTAARDMPVGQILMIFGAAGMVGVAPMMGAMASGHAPSYRPPFVQQQKQLPRDASPTIYVEASRGRHRPGDGARVPAVRGIQTHAAGVERIRQGAALLRRVRNRRARELGEGHAAGVPYRPGRSGVVLAAHILRQVTGEPAPECGAGAEGTGSF